ncbi:MAG: hypothetical protein A2231_01100 [Candidatus Firestonebacteria bacterium RIFOXYA2_FULL_40_8]|nr:MAG: hypothetical protein A2231_01100 [Candidatus Firestonebacteria bacterium RIFOXYA2_FULL_40_8]
MENKEILKIIPLVLYFIVGIISLIMALKILLSGKFLPFHEKAAGKSWKEVEAPLQNVILSLLKLGGLGFLVVAVLLLVYPFVARVSPDTFYKFLIPIIALIFCTGLFFNNYWLYKKTKTDTPWKGSLYAIIIVLAGFIISLFN